MVFEKLLKNLKSIMKTICSFTALGMSRVEVEMAWTILYMY